MTHLSSAADQAFRRDFEACRTALDDFDHRAHLRLAYIYLVERNSEQAYQAMRESLLAFLAHNNIGSGKYHDTMTRAWILAVHHFMHKTESAESADSFIDQNPIMLDAKIMNTHYSTDLLYSDAAREGFAEPDLSPIPRHD